MEETRISDRGAGRPSNSEQSAAEKIVRDAETRSAAGGEGRQVRETPSSYLGMTRREAPVIADEAPGANEASQPSSAPEGDNPAPLSSALGIPTLINESEASSEEQARKGNGENKMEGGPGEAVAKSDAYVTSGAGVPLLSENPTPLSSALHLPTLIKESKPSPER